MTEDRRCGNCRFRDARRADRVWDEDGFCECTAILFSRDAEANTKACVEDCEGYHAFLIVRPDFGCVLWERDYTMPDLFREIESTAFTIRLGPISGKTMFLEALASCDEMKALKRYMVEDDNVLPAVVERLRKAAVAKIDMEFANPWDHALAAYLYAINIIDRNAALSLVDTVAAAPNLHWAAVVAAAVKEKSGNE